ncbi:MarR family transcriptional regulator [Natrinema gelatinilyticum]|uniref:MarR family transcriptional regulator n=1 Tax=Natrinema gelatinilyticum TaxID=2961571 RepID=UPI0020C2BC32|nr:helix-turn-helix domain-containing protein [Natrinema gelatinilyticum]
MSNKSEANRVSRSRPSSSQQVSKERFDRLSDLSPSAKFVYRVLRDGDSLTQNDIAEQTLLPIRTVRYALSKLEQADLVEKQPSVKDARTNYYTSKSVEWDYDSN